MTVHPIAIVSGSGIDLAPLLDHVARDWSFSEIPGAPATLVPGHEGRIYLGRCGAAPVLLQAGRIHLYEGHTVTQAGATIDFMAELGVRTVILLAAAGGVDPALRPGDLVGVDRVWTWPNLRHALPPEQDMGLVLEGLDHQGAYLSMSGPNYETRAEIDMIRRCGAAVVGMSLAAERLRCRQRGMDAAAIACVANLCGAPGGVTHGEVLACMRQASEKLVRHLAVQLPRLAARAV